MDGDRFDQITVFLYQSGGAAVVVPFQYVAALCRSVGNYPNTRLVFVALQASNKILELLVSHAVAIMFKEC